MKGISVNTKRWLCTILMISVLLSLSMIIGVNASSSDTEKSSGDVYREISYSYHTEGKTYNSRVAYSDDMFLTDSTELCPDIAKLSIALSSAAYHRNYINSLLGGEDKDGMGFHLVDNSASYRRVNEELTIDDNDHVAYTIATKEVGDYLVYCVPVKGTSANKEWFSDFNLGDGSVHQGFFEAANEVYEDLKKQFKNDQHDASNRIVLVTGHSRGAAVANLISGWLTKKVNGYYAEPEHVFGYTFACPSVACNADTTLSNIYNFNNPGDLITLLPMEKWEEGYRRYGKTYNTFDPMIERNFQQQFTRLVGTEYEGQLVSDGYLELLLDFLPNKKAYQEPETKLVLDLAAWFLGGKDPKAIDDLLRKDIQEIGYLAVKKMLEKQIAEIVPDPVMFFLSINEKIYHIVDLQLFIFNNQNAVLGMSEEEFEIFLHNNNDKISEIERFTDIDIKTADDFVECGNILGGTIEQGQVFGDKISRIMALIWDENGLLLHGISHAHMQTTYVIWMNSMFYGFEGWYKFNSDILNISSEVEWKGLPICGPVNSIGSGCFYNSIGVRTVHSNNDIRYIGANAFYGNSELGYLDLGIEMQIVGQGAFAFCTSLKELTIPDSVEKLEPQTFRGCSGLKKVTMPIGVELYRYLGGDMGWEYYWAFSGCEDVEELVYTPGKTGISSEYTLTSPGRIEKISKHIKKIELREGITEVKDNFFNKRGYTEESAFDEITIPSTLEKVGNGAFYGQINLEASKSLTNLTEVGSYAFCDCKKLTAKQLGGLPGKLTTISNGAFSGCENLATKIDFSNVTSIGEEAFEHCYSLEEIILPEGIAIGKSAFAFCTSLKELTIPDSVEKLEPQTFRGCSGLKKVTMPIGVELYRYLGGDMGWEYYWAFSGCEDVEELVYTPGKTGISSEYTLTSSGRIEKISKHIKKVELREGITEVKDNFFNTLGYTEERAFDEITIPSTLEKVGSGAFYGQINLEASKSLTNLTEVGSYAFCDCKKLSNVVFSKNAASIGNGAFSGAEALNRVEIYSATAPEVGDDSFPTDCEVHALYYATGYDESKWPQYHPILDLLRPIDTLGHNLNLSGSIGVNYYIHLSDEVLEDEGAKVHFDLPNGLTSEIMVKDAKVKTVKGVECREFGCRLHSSQMTGIIKAKVIMSDGTESEEFPYTVKEYADLMIENPDNNAAFTKVTPLIKAMLNYGGYAQQYFKYDDNPLANEDLTEEERNAIQAVTAEDVKDFERVVTGSQEGLKYEGSNLMLTSETCIRHFFTVQSGHDISEYTFKLDGKELTAVKSGKMYYVEIPNIASGNLDKTYTVTAGGITIQYSAMSYVYTQLGKTDLDADLANTLKALYLYNQEANAYYGR